MIKLTTEQLQTLAQAERILHDLLPDIDHAEKCGADCAALRAENQRIRDIIHHARTGFGEGVPVT